MLCIDIKNYINMEINNVILYNKEKDKKMYIDQSFKGGKSPLGNLTMEKNLKYYYVYEN
ncbi:hypothetical protein C0J52_13571 [Blattella germanica]|nr:hypothetical protein C0J52_13571 [Blattella germanica]